MRTAATTTSWVDALARLRPRDRDEHSSRRRIATTPAPVPARAPGPAATPVPTPGPRAVPSSSRLGTEQACAITGAKRVKKKCCRSTPRCKGCPVVLMRAARAAESGLTGKDLAKAVKRARAA